MAQLKALTNMTNKTIILKDIIITVYERKGFFGTLKIHEQKLKFDRDCHTLLTLFAKLAKANKLPKNSQEVIDFIGQSYRNCEQTFITRKPRAVVLNIDSVIEQLI